MTCCLGPAAASSRRREPPLRHDRLLRSCKHRVPGSGDEEGREQFQPKTCSANGAVLPPRLVGPAWRPHGRCVSRPRQLLALDRARWLITTQRPPRHAGVAVACPLAWFSRAALAGSAGCQPIAVPRNLSCEIASALRCSGGGLVWAPLRSVASAHPDLGRERGGGGFAAAWRRAARARRWRFDTRDRDTRARGCRMAVDRSDGAGAARRCVHV